MNMSNEEYDYRKKVVSLKRADHVTANYIIEAELDDIVEVIKEAVRDSNEKQYDTGNLSNLEEDILAAMCSDAEYCINYSILSRQLKVDRKYLEPAIKNLKSFGYLEFWRGLMTEDGEVAGSGWCRSEKGNQYVEDNQL